MIEELKIRPAQMEELDILQDFVKDATRHMGEQGSLNGTKYTRIKRY